MPNDRDHYQAYYQDKLWNLLPAIYRTLDTDTFNANGPLREMVNRIGKHAAILRRSVDRLWEDQSIETCDDWVIAYIADLLATNLVASLDARGQRIDVAKTIYYRRRKGTLAILEEIAADITGWNARVVEFFRRMGRTRHNFDPEVAGTSALLLEEGLVGLWTGTGAGGWADLRNVYGATKSQSAFDEFSHTADFRLGVDMIGWHNIPHLGVFLWRLYSFGPDQTTPVPYHKCPGQYSFDPTGRQIPLFAAASRTTSASYGDNWVSPQEWQLPGEIQAPLLQAALTDPSDIPLYATVDATGTLTPNSIGVFTKPGLDYMLVDSSHFLDPKNRATIYPEVGRFHVTNGPGGPYFVTYHYGFSSTIGAGPFDRRLPGVAAVVPPAPVATVQGGAPLADPSPTGTITILDSLTYNKISDLANILSVKVQAAQSKRPVLRLPAPTGAGVSAWTLTGSGNQSTLALEGLLISGGDIVLRGTFASVTLTCCTLDPGTSGDSSLFARSVDERDLAPCRLWIEAEIANLVLDRSITGPIHTRNGGSVQTLAANDSIIQGIRTSSLDTPLTVDDVQDPTDLALALRAPGALAAFLASSFDSSTVNALNHWDVKSVPSDGLVTDLIAGLNVALETPLYQPARFAGIALSQATQQLIAQNPSGAALTELNRMLLEEAYPVAFAQAALALGSGEADLERCTILGRCFVHRAEVSECILDDFAVVEDTQHGCVRFSAWTQSSVLPRQYESVQIPAASSIFTSRQFGQPGYGQLLASADAAILSPPSSTIIQGAQDGSEMGAFAREKNPIKERSVLIKYQEYMPLGLVPVIIRVT